MKVRDIIESEHDFSPEHLFVMAGAIGIKSICGIGSAEEFYKAINTDDLPISFDPKASAVVAAYTARFGLDKEVVDNSDSKWRTQHGN